MFTSPDSLSVVTLIWKQFTVQIIILFHRYMEVLTSLYLNTFFLTIQSFISILHNTYISQFTFLIYLTYTLNPPIPSPPLQSFLQQNKAEKKLKRKGCYDDSKIAQFSLKIFIFLLVRAIQSSVSYFIISLSQYAHSDWSIQRAVLSCTAR